MRKMSIMHCRGALPFAVLSFFVLSTTGADAGGHDIIPLRVTCGDYLHAIKVGSASSSKLSSEVKAQMRAAKSLVEELNLPTGPNQQSMVEGIAFEYLPQVCERWPYKPLAWEAVRMYVNADVVLNVGPEGPALGPSGPDPITPWLSH